MNLFLIKIGKNERDGMNGTFIGFKEIVCRSVVVRDDLSKEEVANYFSNLYKGFDIVVEQPEPISQFEDLLNSQAEVNRKLEEEIKKEKEKIKATNGLPGVLSFKVKYDPHEEIVYEEYVHFLNKAERAKNALESSIKARYKKLFFVDYRHDINNGGIVLKTDDKGTYCERLPIKSQDFFKAVLDCTDGGVEIKTEDKDKDKSEITGTDTIDLMDIPF